MVDNVIQLELPVKQKKERRPQSLESDFWSPGGQIYYSYGFAWGVASDGPTVCMGREVAILDALEHNMSTGVSGIDNILRIEVNERGKDHRNIVRKRRRK